VVVCATTPSKLARTSTANPSAPPPISLVSEQDAEIMALFSEVGSTPPTADRTMTDDISPYAFLKPHGPVCMDGALSLLCSQAFPLCGSSATHKTTAHNLVTKTCHSDCVATFQACGADSSEAGARCNAMSSSTEQHLAKASVTKTCAPLPSVAKSECTMATGLTTCANSNGRYVSLDSLLFSSLQDADQYVAQALAIIAAPNSGSRFSVCPQSATILLCSQFLPECNPSDGTRLRLCHSTCADAIWSCNFDQVHNYSNACDGVGLASLSGGQLMDSVTGSQADASLSDTLSSYVSTYVAPPVSSSIDPTASVCGYAALPALEGVTVSRYTTHPVNSPPTANNSASFSKSVFAASLAISILVALLIGCAVGWFLKARSLASQNREDIAMEQSTGYRPLVSTI